MCENWSACLKTFPWRFVKLSNYENVIVFYELYQWLGSQTAIPIYFILWVCCFILFPIDRNRYIFKTFTVHTSVLFITSFIYLTFLDWNMICFSIDWNCWSLNLIPIINKRIKTIGTALSGTLLIEIILKWLGHMMVITMVVAITMAMV